MKRAKVVAITGASGGVGRAIARAFGQRGDQVALLARGAAGLAGACAEVEAAGGKALAIETDVADPAQVEAAAARIERELGPIDIWVNNAMTTIFAPVMQIEPEEFRRATEVTYLGTVWGTMTALKRMKPRGRGHIIQVGSALAYRAIPLQSAYCGAKFAIRGFTDALRCELMHEGIPITLTMVHLSAFNTPQFNWALSRMPRQPQPVPPIFDPQLAAQAVLKAADGHEREIWVGYPAAKAILGNHLAPWLADRVLVKQGYKAQQTEEPTPPDRPANLFEPADQARDYGTQGPFTDRIMRNWQQLTLSDWLWYLLAAALPGSLLTSAMLLRLGRGSRLRR